MILLFTAGKHASDVWKIERNTKNGTYANLDLNVSICSRIFKIETESFNLFKKNLKSNWNVLAISKFFFTSSEHFSLLQASQVSKQNFCIYKMLYQNENKTFALSLKFVVSKQNNTLDTGI